MHDHLLDICAKLPADYAEIRIHEAASTSVRYSGKQLEDIGERTGLSGCVRVLVAGGWGFVSFNDLDDVERYARQAVEQARLIGGEPFELAPVEPVRASWRNEPESNPCDVPLADKQAMCDRYNQLILADKRIQTSTVIYRDSRSHRVFVNSEGSCIEQEYTFCGAMLGAIAMDGANIQRAYKSTGDLRGFAQTAGLDADCEDVVRRAIESLSADPVEAGTYDVILDPQLCGVFVHEAFGHLSESDFVCENPRLREMMELGRRFGDDILSITDDGSLAGEAGFIAFDDEGVPGSCNPLIKDGILVGRLHNRETASRMDEAPTGSARAISSSHAPIVRMTNTYMHPGDTSFEQMLADTPDGLYAVGMLGGQTNMEMFTFSPEEAWRIRDGQIAEKVREVVLTGNVFQTLANIDRIGNDPKMHGGLGGCGKGGQSPLRVGDGGPHCRIKDVVVGGR